MTSSNRNIFRVTGHLCREFTGHRWIPPKRPVTRSFDVFFDLRLNKRLSKQTCGCWWETPSRPLWRHCNDEVHVDPSHLFTRIRRSFFTGPIVIFASLHEVVLRCIDIINLHTKIKKHNSVRTVYLPSNNTRLLQCKFRGLWAELTKTKYQNISWLYFKRLLTT